MKDLINKFTKRGELEVDLFSGTIMTAKTCLKLLRYSCYVSYEVDADCFTAGTEVLVETYARQILN